MKDHGRRREGREGRETGGERSETGEKDSPGGKVCRVGITLANPCRGNFPRSARHPPHQCARPFRHFPNERPGLQETLFGGEGRLASAFQVVLVLVVCPSILLRSSSSSNSSCRRIRPLVSPPSVCYDAGFVRRRIGGGRRRRRRGRLPGGRSVELAELSSPAAVPERVLRC